MFPTRYKSKIPQFVSYPVNAKLIYEALADVPQAQSLTQSFSSYRSFHRNDGLIPVISVGYMYLKANRFTSHTLEELGWCDPKWDISVDPIPRTMKGRITALIENHALPKMRAWLCERADLTGKQESQSFNVFYDEGRDELKYREHRHP